MKPDEMRIALFSGNYNYVRDGANQALNRLVDYLLRKGAKVRIYAPMVEKPAFPPTGDLVAVSAVPIPLRAEYRIPVALSDSARRDLEAFQPNIVHVSSPDVVAHRALSWARRRGIPVVASVHTRFETYLQYYRLQWLEPVVRGLLRRFYRRCDAIVAPAESTAAILRGQRMASDISIWARGVDRVQFNPERRSLDWRRAHGIGDEEMLVLFLGRIVAEKGLDVFSAAIAAAVERDVKLRVLVVGEGPARAQFAEQLPPGAVFTGLLTGIDLATAVASSDLLLNPSVTEAFGNVTLEAMACAVPVIAADASGATNLVQDGKTGTLIAPGDIDGFADAIARYQRDPRRRVAHGKAGLAIARKMDWDEINAAVTRVYSRVIERRRRTG